MNGMKLSNKIEELLEDDKLDTELALRLMLLTQMELLERIESVETIANGNSEYLAHYPSVLWLWVHRRKSTILVVVVIFLLLYFLLIPISVSDIRHAIFEALGLPSI